MSQIYSCRYRKLTTIIFESIRYHKFLLVNIGNWQIISSIIMKKLVNIPYHKFSFLGPYNFVVELTLPLCFWGKQMIVKSMLKDTNHAIRYSIPLISDNESIQLIYCWLVNRFKSEGRRHRQWKRCNIQGEQPWPTSSDAPEAAISPFAIERLYLLSKIGFLKRGILLQTGAISVQATF